MRYLAILFLASSALFAAMPNLSGIWKADLAKSKFSGPPPTSYLVIIEQKSEVVDDRSKEKAPEFIENTGTVTQRGEHRAVLTAFDYAKPVYLEYQGIPTRLTGTGGPGTFTIMGEIPGTTDYFKRTYTLSLDGQTLTLEIEGSSDRHPITSNIVFNRGSEGDVETLRKPEQLASVQFKNVKEDSLNNLPASEFINQMNYFSWSLGKKCNFCHVERKFDSDDKKEKKSAREMVEMVAEIDKHHFEGHPAVRCFTCHEGHEHPLSHPIFVGEIDATDEREHDEHNPPPHN